MPRQALQPSRDVISAVQSMSEFSLVSISLSACSQPGVTLQRRVTSGAKSSHIGGSTY